MADQRIGDLIDRISEDMKDIENAQSLIRKAAQNTQRIQNEAARVIENTDSHLTKVQETVNGEILPQITAAVQQLNTLNDQNQDLFDQINGLDFISLKDKITGVQSLLSSKIDNGLSSISDNHTKDTNSLSQSISALGQSISNIAQNLKTLDAELRNNYSQTKGQLDQVKQMSDRGDKKADEFYNYQKDEFKSLNQKYNDTQSNIVSILKDFNKHKRTQKLWLILLSAGVGLLLLLQVLTYFFPPASLGFNISRSNINKEISSQQGVPVNKRSPKQNTSNQKKSGDRQIFPANPPDMPGNLLPPEKAQNKLGKRAEYVMTYLKGRNFAKLASKYFHPEYGVRFMPFGLSSDGKTLSPERIIQAWESGETIEWGKTTNGKPLKLNMKAYYKAYIYDKQYLLTTPTYNNLNLREAEGITLEKLSELFVDGIFVEYANEQSSVILVFQEPVNGYPSVSGIIHVAD